MAYKIEKASTKFCYGMSNPAQLEEWVQDNQDMIGLSFLGRSNVGKSSTINALFGRSVARTSKTPGRTREINIFSFNILNKKGDGVIERMGPFYFFDLPGYGHAEVSKKMAGHWGVLMNYFFSNAPESILMLNLQDARHPHQKADVEFHKYLKGFDFETILTFNKIDKLKTQKERAALNKLKPQLFKEYKRVKQIYFTSAEKKTGIDTLEDSIINFLLKNKIRDNQITKSEEAD